MKNKFRYWIMLNPISRVLFCLMPGSIESRKGLLREKIADSFKKFRSYWFKTEPLQQPNSRIFLAEFTPPNKLFVRGLTSNYLDYLYTNMVVGFRLKTTESSDSTTYIKGFSWRITPPTTSSGCTLIIGRWFAHKNKYLINDGKHEFIVYFVYD